ncbi:pilus assembly protein PilM [bacterium]|nr:pilus assembly protein PilM [bacterium]
MELLNFTSSASWSRVLGVELGQEALKYVLLNRKGGKPLVESFGKYTYKGAQDAVEGLYEAVPQLFKNRGYFKNAKLIIGINEAMVVMKTDSFPPLTDKELKQTIAFSFEKELASGEEGAAIVCGNYPMGSDPDKKENQLHIVVGMYEDEVHQIVQPFIDQGLIPVKLVVRMMALGNLVAMLPHGRSDIPVGILNIGPSKSMLAIFRKGKLDFHREIVMGDMDFTKAIIGTIFHEGKAIQFSMEEAVEFKNKFGYPLGFADSMSFKGAPLSELGAMMRPVVERLTGEIQRSIGFYSDKTKGQSVDSLFLIGKGAKIQHLDQVLNQRVGIPVARLPLPKTIAVSGGKKQRSVFKKKFPDHTISLAVASETTQNGNLLPDVYRIRQWQSAIQKWGAVVGFVFLGWMVVAAAGVFYQTSNLKSNIKRAKKIALEAETAERRYGRAITQKDELHKTLVDIHKRIEQDQDLVQVLRLFSHQLPKELMISRFDYKWEKKKVPKKEPARKASRKKASAKEAQQTEIKNIRRVVFEGGSNAPKADVKIAVADFLIHLQESGYFEKVELNDELLQEKSGKENSGGVYWFQAQGLLKE